MTDIRYWCRASRHITVPRETPDRPPPGGNKKQVPVGYIRYGGGPKKNPQDYWGSLYIIIAFMSPSSSFINPASIDFLTKSSIFDISLNSLADARFRIPV